MELVRANPEFKLPVVLSGPEVRNILSKVEALDHRVCLATIYSCGLRLGEGQQRQRLLLPVPYFLVTFTVPDRLRSWIRSHSQIGYEILFDASAQALQGLAANPKRLGAQLGMLGILHTWSRTLIFHPHVHYLVPGGGLSLDHRQWIASNPKFLFAEKPLGLHFRTLFRQRLQQRAPEALDQLPAKIWKQNWGVDCAAAGSGENALAYLARYVFKTATGNRLFG